MCARMSVLLSALQGNRLLMSLLPRGPVLFHQSQPTRKLGLGGTLLQWWRHSSSLSSLLLLLALPERA